MLGFFMVRHLKDMCCRDSFTFLIVYLYLLQLGDQGDELMGYREAEPEVTSLAKN